MNSNTLYTASVPADREITELRHYEAGLRLGGWLFVPAPGLVVEPKRIQHHSPVRRSGDAAPVVDELYRTGGEAIYYSESKRCVLTVIQYRKLLRERPHAVREDWRIMQRSMVAYARGTVCHPDHNAVTLPDWHRILMNSESQASAMQQVAFID